MMRLIVISQLLVVMTTYSQSSIVGKWKTVDDDTGEVMSVVEIFERKGLFYGKIIKVFNKEDPDPVCDKCPTEDPRYMKKIVGMEIIKDMRKTDDEYTDGTILDPKAGKIYRCKLWFEGTNLLVRGYWGPFYRTQTWGKST